MQKKILVVDDSATMLQTISLTLEKEDFDVVTAENGEVALKKLASGTKFNLIITDVNMPKMDGIELTRNIRKMNEYKFIPIIIVTTESEIKKKDEGKKAGATGWIVKPFKPSQMLTVIRKVCP